MCQELSVSARRCHEALEVARVCQELSGHTRNASKYSYKYQCNAMFACGGGTLCI